MYYSTSHRLGKNESTITQKGKRPIFFPDLLLHSIHKVRVQSIISYSQILYSVYYFLQPDTLCVLFPTDRYFVCIISYSQIYFAVISIADILHKLTAQENTPTASAESNEKLFKDLLLTHGQYLRENKQTKSISLKKNV